MLQKTTRKTTPQKAARIAIVASVYNTEYVDSMIDAALETLAGSGVDDVELIRVPGAFEMPLATQKVGRQGEFDAIITLGAVIRGGTPHFDFVAGECASGISKLAMEESMPIVFGVLTTDTIEQAIERSGTKAGNKGADVAMSAMEMVSLMRKLS